MPVQPVDQLRPDDALRRAVDRRGDDRVGDRRVEIAPLHLVRNAALFRQQEPRAHGDTVGPPCQCGDETPPVVEPARPDHGDRVAHRVDHLR